MQFHQNIYFTKFIQENIGMIIIKSKLLLQLRSQKYFEYKY